MDLGRAIKSLQLQATTSMILKIKISKWKHNSSAFTRIEEINRMCTSILAIQNKCNNNNLNSQASKPQ